MQADTRPLEIAPDKRILERRQLEERLPSPLAWFLRALSLGALLGVLLLADGGKPLPAVGLLAALILFLLAVRQLVLSAQRRSIREELGRHAAHAEFLVKASSILTSSLDYNQTLRNVASIIVPELADVCVVDVVEVNGTLTRQVVTADAELERAVWDLTALKPPGSAPPFSIPANLRALGVPVRSNIGALIPSVESAEPEIAAMHAQIGLDAMMLVGMSSQGELLGAITFANITGSRPFDDSDYALACDFAARAAVAIEHSRLYAQRDHIARTLQAALSPPKLPDVPGISLGASYRALGHGAEIGGDFYDVFELPDGTWMLVLGDVQGKGVEAAVLTSLIHYTLRTLSMQARSPAALLQRLNTVVRAHDSDGKLATIALVRLRLDGARAHGIVALGGHPPPLHRRNNGSTVAVGRPGTLIGAFEELNVSDEPFELGPGETLLLYSDGATEAPGRDGLRLDESGLRTLLSVHGSPDATATTIALEQAVSEFAAELQDDFALLCCATPNQVELQVAADL